MLLDVKIHFKKNSIYDTIVIIYVISFERTGKKYVAAVCFGKFR